MERTPHVRVSGVPACHKKQINLSPACCVPPSFYSHSPVARLALFRVADLGRRDSPQPDARRLPRFPRRSVAMDYAGKANELMDKARKKLAVRSRPAAPRPGPPVPRAQRANGFTPRPVDSRPHPPLCAVSGPVHPRCVPHADELDEHVLVHQQVRGSRRAPREGVQQLQARQDMARESCPGTRPRRRATTSPTANTTRPSRTSRPPTR